MFVNVVHKHVLFYFILFGIMAQREGETNSCDCWPSKSNPLKVMRATMKKKKERRGDARRKREGQ
jgi:hypothetical protein